MMTDDDYRQLIESEATLRAFMDVGPVLAFMKDDQLRYVYANPHMERVFGITLADLRGKVDMDWLPEAVARSVRGHDLRVLESGTVVEHMESLPMPDGRTGHWLVVKFPFTHPNGRRFVGGVGIDVTALEEARTRLAESERRYRHLMESAQGLICTHDLSGRLLSVNRAAREALGYTEAELVGVDIRALLGKERREAFNRYLERIDYLGSDSGLLLARSKDGRDLAWQYHNVRVIEAGQPPYVLGHAQNVTELRDTQEQLRTLAMTDDLTGLHNRRGFFTHATRLLRWAFDHHRSVAAVYVDIDGLKRINDALGHEVGSAMIVHAGDVLKQTFRAADVVSRIGGDEFVVLAAISPDDAPIITTRLDRHLEVFNRSSGVASELSLSLGIAYLEPGSTATLEELVRQADAAMYVNKRGRERRAAR